MLKKMINKIPFLNNLYLRYVKYRQLELGAFNYNWVIEIFKKKRNGYFVEAGAHNGISGSNTYVLENKYHWQGS